MVCLSFSLRRIRSQRSGRASSPARLSIACFTSTPHRNASLRRTPNESWASPATSRKRSRPCRQVVARNPIHESTARGVPCFRRDSSGVTRVVANLSALSWRVAGCLFTSDVRSDETTIDPAAIAKAVEEYLAKRAQESSEGHPGGSTSNCSTSSATSGSDTSRTCGTACVVAIGNGSAGGSGLHTSCSLKSSSVPPRHRSPHRPQLTTRHARCWIRQLRSQSRSRLRQRPAHVRALERGSQREVRSPLSIQSRLRRSRLGRGRAARGPRRWLHRKDSGFLTQFDFVAGQYVLLEQSSASDASIWVSQIVFKVKPGNSASVTVAVWLLPLRVGRSRRIDRLARCAVRVAIRTPIAMSSESSTRSSRSPGRSSLSRTT